MILLSGLSDGVFGKSEEIIWRQSLVPRKNCLCSKQQTLFSILALEGLPAMRSGRVHVNSCGYNLVDKILRNLR